MGDRRDSILISIDSIKEYAKLILSNDSGNPASNAVIAYLTKELLTEVEILKENLEPETISVPVETYDTLKRELE
jgi:hypothetical protein